MTTSKISLTSLEIQPASLLDLGSVHQIEQVCFGQDSWPLPDLIAVLTLPNVVRLKAVIDGRIVGFVAGDQRGKTDIGWIATLAVLPAYQRQGIGRALLNACEEKLRSPRIRLCVRTDNLIAIHLYHQEGYRTIDLWPNYYKDGASALVLEKIRP